MDSSDTAKAQVLSVEQSQQDDRQKVLKSAVSTVAALRRLLADYERLETERNDFERERARVLLENNKLRKEAKEATDQRELLVRALETLTTRMDAMGVSCIEAAKTARTQSFDSAVVHELTYKRPWINPRFAAGGNMPLLLLFISFFRFVILSTSYIIPQYLTTVQNYRAIEIGGALKWVALPQFLSAPAVATVLRFVDARLTMAFGFALVGCACFMAGQLTHDWVSEDFLRSQLLQAVGQSFGLTSLVWFSLKHLEPSEIFTFGAVLQTGRLFGAQLGSAFVQTFVRTREQTYSNLIGLHVNAGSLLTDQRLEQYAKAVAGRSVGDPEAAARATALLARAVQNQAYVLAYIDGFMVLGFAVIGALLLMLLLRDPPAHLEQPAARR